MKRCPQCEFTFEDHNNFCDFDGSELSPIFERPLSARSYSILSHVLMPMARRLLQSNFSLAVLALTGIVFSALVVGYYSATDVQSKGETVEAIPALVTQELVKSPVASAPTSVSTFVSAAHPKRPKVLPAQRSRISSQSASMQFARASVRSAVFRSSKQSSSNVRVAKVRQRSIQPQLEVRTAAGDSSKLFQARDQKHAEALRQVKPSRSAVGEDDVKLTGGYSSSTGKSLVVFPQKKDSKFIAAMKKTGRVLSWPFRF